MNLEEVCSHIVVCKSTCSQIEKLLRWTSIAFKTSLMFKMKIKELVNTKYWNSCLVVVLHSMISLYMRYSESLKKRVKLKNSLWHRLILISKQIQVTLKKLKIQNYNLNPKVSSPSLLNKFSKMRMKMGIKTNYFIRAWIKLMMTNQNKRSSLI